MTIPHAPRIAVLVLATTAFYGYVGQMVPQSEVQPPEEIAIRADLTTPEMVEIGREIAEGKGLCRTCHTIGSSGALRFPDLAGVAGSEAERVRAWPLSTTSPNRCCCHKPDAFVVPGFNPGMPTINRPPIGLTDPEILCVIAYLESLGGTPTGHAADESPLLRPTTQPGAAPAQPGAAPGAPVATPAGRAPRRLHRPRQTRTPGLASIWLSPGPQPGERRQVRLLRLQAPRARLLREDGSTMNILVVVAVVAAFGLLRFRQASLLLWAVGWWAGIYVLLRFGFTIPIPASSSRSTWESYPRDPGLLVFDQERRDEVSRPLIKFMTEKRYPPVLGAMAVAIPALAAANVYVEMNVPVEPPFFSRTIHTASPSEIRVLDKTIPIDAGENPSDRWRHRIRKSSANTSKTGARSTIGTASSATATTWGATACSRMR